VIDPLLYLAAGLLAWAGGAKVWSPDGTVRALSASGLVGGSSRFLVRVLGVVEMAVGLCCLLGLGPAAPAALAVMYLAFALYLLTLIVREVPTASCGCLGRADTPPSLLHVSVDLTAVAVGVLATFDPPQPAWSVLGGLPLWGIPSVVALAAAGYLIALAETYLPTLFSSFRRHPAS
jgi:Methylamine utilisation protein MauE